MQDENITSSSEGQSSEPQVTLESLTTDRNLINQIQDLGYVPLTKFQQSVIPLILEGKDVIAQGPIRGRSLAFGIALAIKKDNDGKGRSLIVTDTEGDAERISRGLNDLGVAAAKVGAKKGGKNTINTAVALVGTTQGVLDAFDQGVIEGSRIVRAILDGTEPGIQSGRMEELLNLLHDLPTTQLIHIRNDTSMNIANFIKKFFKSPAEVVVEDSVEPVREEETRAPRQSRRDDRRTEIQSDGAEGVDVAPTAPATPAKPKKAPANAQHVYFELPADLLAKPNALSDLIEGSGSPATVIFCNSPSEADLTDVMLRKRGIIARKLIGFVPPSKVTSAVEALKNKECTALVVTDVSAREMQIPALGLVVNYSIHSDPEVYLQRAAVAEEGETPVKVVSLIIPLDLANFHSLKKFVAVEFTKAEPPSKEEALKAKIATLSTRAKEKAFTSDERVKTLLALIEKDENREEILALLIHNTFDALPAALAKAESASAPRETRDSYDQDDGGEFNRRGDRDDRRGGRNRRDRNDRRGRRDDRRDEYTEGAPQGESYGADSERREGRNDEDNRGRRDRRPRRDEGQDGEAREPYVPPARDLRLYFGHGSKGGFTQEKAMELITSKGELTAEQVKRTIVRDLYTFVDVPEELADTVVAKLNESEVAGVGKVFVRKAVTITAPREEKKQADDDMGAQEAIQEGAASGGESEIVSQA